MGQSLYWKDSWSLAPTLLHDSSFWWRKKAAAFLLFCLTDLITKTCIVKPGKRGKNHYSCHKPSSTTFTLLQPTKKPIWESSTHKPERKSIIPRKCVGFFPQKKVLIQSLRPSLALAACASKVCAGNLWKLHSGCTDRVYSGARISTPSPLYQQWFLFCLCMILSLTLQK